MTAILRWGILGTGNIARQFVAGLKTARRASVVAVGSRERSSAEQFVSAQSFSATVGSYDDVLRAADVDAVYVSLPNSMHHEWTIKALRAGKHVLCEKPIASNEREAAEMFDVADQTGRLLVEAFMYRSHPMILAALDAVSRGEIGRVKLIRSSFCYNTKRVDGNIRFEASLAGGALMDIGCYCANFSRAIAQSEPVSMHATGHLHASGVDDLAAVTLSFPDDIVASFTVGMGLQADNSAYICGDEGYIEIPIPWKPPAADATFTVARQTPPKMDLAARTTPLPPPRELRSFDAGIDLFACEADDFAATVLDGTPPRITRQDSVGNMIVLDALRQQLGVRVVR